MQSTKQRYKSSSKHLITLEPKAYFSSQNPYQKFSLRTACLGPCPWGKEEEKVTCLKGKSTCPGRPDGVFFEPCQPDQIIRGLGEI